MFNDRDIQATLNEMSAKRLSESVGVEIKGEDLAWMTNQVTPDEIRRHSTSAKLAAMMTGMNPGSAQFISGVTHGFALAHKLFAEKAKAAEQPQSEATPEAPASQE